jgi:plastocyanin
MAGQSWSITINGKPASFDADVFGTDPGQPLKAQLGDLVSWNNQTGRAHQICLADETGAPVKDDNGKLQKLTKRIAKYTSSFPGYVTANTDIRPTSSPLPQTGTIYYCCSIHPEEKGQIEVVL